MKHYNRTNTCDRCGRSFDKIGWQHPKRECDEKGDWTGRWDCSNCLEEYDPNSQRNVMKLVTDRRTGNQDPNHSNAKGDKGQKLLNIWKGWSDLNEKDNDYKSPIDSIDYKTRLLYQTKCKWYDPINRCWCFTALERELFKKFKSMLCFCISKDGKTVERLYEFTKEVFNGRTGITIVKSPTDSRGNSITPWYEQYVLKDEEELKKLNKIWKKINNN